MRSLDRAVSALRVIVWVIMHSLYCWAKKKSTMLPQARSAF